MVARRAIVRAIASGSSRDEFGKISRVSLRRRRASLAPGAGRERFLDLIVHKIERLREGCVYIQIGRIQQDGIICLAQGSGLTCAIAVVAYEKLRLDGCDIGQSGAGCRVALELQPAAERAD